MEEKLLLICPEGYLETIVSQHFEIGFFIYSENDFINIKEHFLQTIIEPVEYYQVQDVYFSTYNSPTLKSLRVRKYGSGSLSSIVSVILSVNLDDSTSEEKFIIANFEAKYESLILRNIPIIFNSRLMFTLNKETTKVSIGKQQITGSDFRLLTLNFDSITTIKTSDNYIKKKSYLDSN